MTMIFAGRARANSEQNGENEFASSKAEDLFSEVNVVFGTAIFDGTSVLLVMDCAVDLVDPSCSPPQFAEMILILALSPKKYRDSQVGDLAEDFVRYRAKYGRGFARLWYWKEVLREVSYAIPRSIRWGLILAWVEETIRWYM
jgi:hypothetical protein